MSPKVRVPLLLIGMTIALMLVPAVHHGERSHGAAEAVPAVEHETTVGPQRLSAKAEAPDIPGIILHHAP